MDKRSEKLLKLINEMSNESYKVLELSEVINKLPKKYNLLPADIKNILKYLSERDYIDIKFVDDKNMCVASLPKGRLHFENILQQNKVTNSYRKLFIASILVSGLMAFLGAFLAIYLF